MSMQGFRKMLCRAFDLTVHLVRLYCSPASVRVEKFDSTVLVLVLDSTVPASGRAKRAIQLWLSPSTITAMGSRFQMGASSNFPNTRVESCACICSTCQDTRVDRIKGSEFCACKKVRFYSSRPRARFYCGCLRASVFHSFQKFSIYLIHLVAVSFELCRDHEWNLIYAQTICVAQKLCVSVSELTCLHKPIAHGTQLGHGFSTDDLNFVNSGKGSICILDKQIWGFLKI